jgi:phage tail sheath protein FI
VSAALTYPGVYVREIPSGVRTITGVATSIAAFVGRARKGPLDEPVAIDNFSDFVRTFGDLSVESSLGYAVRQFYLNGGGTAIVVRVAGDGVKRASFELPKDAEPNVPLTLEATEPGSWANSLTIEIGYPDPDVPNKDRFNIVVYDGSDIVARYIGVSIDESDPRYYPRVLEQRGSVIRVQKDNGNYKIAKDKADEPNNPGKAIRPPETTKPEDRAKSKDDGSDGGELTDKTFAPDDADDKKGIYALASADIFNLLVIPPPTRDGYTSNTVYQAAIKFCREHRAVLLVDPPKEWTDAASITPSSVSDLGFGSDDLSYGAVYFPRLEAPDSERDGQLAAFPPSGAVAGVIARTDANRGVWKAPAGTDAGLGGLTGLTLNLTDGENGRLNPHGVNCLRSFPVWGRVVWGARTLKGDDQQADEYKYLPVRRLALYIEESLYRGLKWVVFEPNDEPLWSQIRLNVGVFLHNLFRQGAFEGTTPAEAYFVKCDKETTTQADIDLGIVNIVVGFAPLKPAEFVVLKIQQIAGKLEA